MTPLELSTLQNVLARQGTWTAQHNPLLDLKPDELLNRLGYTPDTGEPSLADRELNARANASTGFGMPWMYAVCERLGLGEGQPATWRLLLIKVSAEVVVSCRRVVVRLSNSWPYLDYYRQVCAAVLSAAALPAGG